MLDWSDSTSSVTPSAVAIFNTPSGTEQTGLGAIDRSGKLVAEADNVAYSYADKPIVRGLSTTVLRGDKLGIIGPNGAGKTTLINLLLGRLQPTGGTLKLGTDRLSINGTVAPAYTVNRVLGRIPVIGQILSGSGSDAALAATFRVNGSMSSPQISVNPLAALVPGMIRDLFSAFTADNDQGSSADQR